MLHLHAKPAEDNGPSLHITMPSAVSTTVLLRRLLRWLIDSKAEGHEVRRAMQLTLLEPPHLSILGFFWTQAAALIAWQLTAHWWALAWMGTDTLLFVLRLRNSRRMRQAAERQQRLPTAPLFVVQMMWVSTIACGTFLTVSEPDVRLILIGTVLAVGFCGYVVSRFQAFPRCALPCIHGLWGGLFAGLLASPIPGAASMAWLMPAGAAAFHMMLMLNHDIIATALRAQQENRRLSMHDPLTELPNRLMLRERLTQLCNRLGAGAGGGGGPVGFAVLCLDLDDFKTVNDRHGHAAGDWLLKSVSGHLLASVRTHDLVCRIGGDEFVLLLPGASEAEAIAIAERLLSAVAQPHDPGDPVSVHARVSVGIAMAPRHGTRPDELLAAADAGLYAAKRAGKGVWQLHRSTAEAQSLAN